MSAFWAVNQIGSNISYVYIWFKYLIHIIAENNPRLFLTFEWWRHMSCRTHPIPPPCCPQWADCSQIWWTLLSLDCGCLPNLVYWDLPQFSQKDCFYGRPKWLQYKLKRVYRLSAYTNDNAVNVIDIKQLLCYAEQSTLTQWVSANTEHIINFAQIIYHTNFYVTNMAGVPAQ